MPFSEDHDRVVRAVNAVAKGHNPDGVRDDRALEMAPDLWARMMGGEITPLQARREWAEREPANRAFNNEMRRRANFGYVVDAQETLAQPDEPQAVRDAQTGQYADLSQAARDAAGYVPTETPPPADANSLIRASYERMLEQRGERR
jgi:hypothetical protein